MAGSSVSPLVSPSELAVSLGRPDLVVIDMRSAAIDGGGRPVFEEGHIPGAVHTDYVADGWRARVGGAPGMLPAPTVLAALFGRLGIGPGDHVVVVPGGTSSGDFAAAARIYWTFKAAGHSRVSLLDGGMAAWRAGGLPIEAGSAPTREALPYPVRPDASVRATLPDVEEAVRDRSASLVDARDRASFTGDKKSGDAARPGRLPGSVLVDGAELFDKTAGRLRPGDELERLVQPAGRGPVISFCNTGQSAATDWFVLSEILRRPGVRLYDGSMSEWTEDPKRPVETGAVPAG